ncbi:MAG: hypothetical protein Q8O19_05005 [Rectinemataceae bacterium]|nr:hypothetical protein [Rectinemataceae bacterium]
MPDVDLLPVVVDHGMIRKLFPPISKIVYESAWSADRKVSRTSLKLEKLDLLTTLYQDSRGDLAVG